MRAWDWVTEQVTGWGTGLRSSWRAISGSFYPTQPAYDKTIVNYDVARQLYRNDGSDTHLGAGFCKPIIDNAVSFIGVPTVSSEDEAITELLNTNIQKIWNVKLQEMYRNAMRDSKTVVRIWQPLLDDPLTTDEERTACQLTIYEPERVTITYDPRNPNMITQALIVSKVEWPDPIQPTADAPRGTKPQIKEHEIWEIITPNEYRYYDKTDNQWLSSWTRVNNYGFVPMMEVYNEYDSALTGGQSDLESSLPFIRAFHEVLLQSLKAHAYHSIPKLTFNVQDILGFLRNNFPDTIGEDGQPIPGATINWKGREVLVLGPEESLGFIEMKSILADSHLMLEFLIDCISVASETPEWAFMRVESGTSQGAMNAQTVPFEKKIERKRIMFSDTIQMICKMCLSINGKTPIRPEIVWDEIRPENIAAMAQAVQQLVMSLEVILERKLISDNTAREALRVFRIFRSMKQPTQEAKDAESNFELPMPTTQPPGLPEPAPNGNKKTKPKVSA